MRSCYTASTRTLAAWMTLLAACTGSEAPSVSGSREDSDGVARGTLTLREPITLPPDALAVVSLRAEGGVPPSSTLRWRWGGARLPLPFEIPLPAGTASGSNLSLRGAVVVDGRVAWTSAWVTVDPTGDVDLGDLELIRSPDRAFEATLVCGPTVASVGFDVESIRLRIEDRAVELVPAVSASGTRYDAVGDSSTWLWDKGRVATLSLDGRELPGCVVVESLTDAVRARGNEPFWSLVIGPAAVTFATPEGTGPTPDRWLTTTVSGERHYVTMGDPVIEATFHDRPCFDTMSGMPYPFEVVARVAGREYLGCGGEPVELLLGAAWVVEAIGDQEVTSDDPPLVSFGADGRVTVVTPCNAYTGDFTLTGEGLTFSPLAVTRRACPPGVMELEPDFLQMLQGVQRFGVSEEGELRLEASDGRSVRARR